MSGVRSLTRLKWSLCGALVALASCDSSRARFVIAGHHLCPPRSVLIDGPAWLPKDLNDDGFAFELPPDALSASGKLVPLRDLLGRKAPHSMSVGTAEIAREWAAGGEKLVEQLRRRPSFREELHPSGKYRVLYDSPARESWWVVSIPEAQPAGAQQVPSAIVAQCAVERLPSITVGQRGIVQIDCERFAVTDDIAISYSFDYANLPQIAAIDREIIGIVRGWACDR